MGRLLLSAHHHRKKSLAPGTGSVKPPRWLSEGARSFDHRLPENTYTESHEIYICENELSLLATAVVCEHLCCLFADHIGLYKEEVVTTSRTVFETLDHRQCKRAQGLSE